MGLSPLPLLPISHRKLLISLLNSLLLQVRSHTFKPRHTAWYFLSGPWNAAAIPSPSMPSPSMPSPSMPSPPTANPHSTSSSVPRPPTGWTRRTVALQDVVSIPSHH
ncbi:hypothetical protein DL95DRAFT_399349 [Leptodontidium sp. 2 PMI_412]|nr:hypothetical protein DL95DRAFT_399349 [Leptodontidium sp. 2 PMI_412]